MYISNTREILINLYRNYSKDIKDMEDIEGDKINNISTFTVVFGFQFSKYLLIFVPKLGCITLSPLSVKIKFFRFFISITFIILF